MKGSVDLPYVLEVPKTEVVVKLVRLLDSGLPRPLLILVYRWLCCYDYLTFVNVLFQQNRLDLELLFCEQEAQVSFGDGQSLRLTQGVIYETTSGGYDYAKDIASVPAYQNGSFPIFYLRIETIRALLDGESLVPINSQLGEKVKEDAEYYLANPPDDDPLHEAIPMALKVLCIPRAEGLITAVFNACHWRRFADMPARVWVLPVFAEEPQQWLVLHLCCNLVGKPFYDLYCHHDLNLLRLLSDEMLVRHVRNDRRVFSLLYTIMASPDAESFCRRLYGENKQRFLQIVKANFAMTAITRSRQDPSLLFWLCHFSSGRNLLCDWLQQDPGLLDGHYATLKQLHTVNIAGVPLQTSGLNGLSQDVVICGFFAKRDQENLGDQAASTTGIQIFQSLQSPESRPQSNRSPLRSLQT